MAIITLTTDWGERDYFVSALKGSVLSLFHDVTFVDISHTVERHNIAMAAYVFKNAYKYFPAGTTHYISVDSFIGHGKILGIKHEGQNIIGPDCGIFSMVFNEKPKEIYELNLNPYDLKNFNAVATPLSKLAMGGALKSLGKPVDAYMERIFPNPVVEEKMMKGSIIYVDHFGNLITNITEELFTKTGRARPFTVYLRRMDEYPLRGISQHYYEVPNGEIVALFNSAGMLEIALNEANASVLLGIKNGEVVRIDFHDNKNS